MESDFTMIAPMLATAAEPFDSPNHLFEIKWDGIRALAAVTSGGWQLWGRGASGYTERYPELDVLRALPPGTVLDGELVRWTPAGRADFPAVLGRHQLTSSHKIRWAARHTPVSYVVFDLLQLGGKCLLSEPLSARRERLQRLAARQPAPRLRLSAGVIGRGKTFFEHTQAQGHEGVMAKRLDSRYQPGKRSSAWRKIKPREVTLCVIFGYRARRDDSPRSLLLAAQRDGQLQYVGEVCCRQRETDPWAARLKERPSDTPLVPCRKRAHWVCPDLYCQVRHFGWTARGRLRFPALVRLLPSQ